MGAFPIAALSRHTIPRPLRRQLKRLVLSYRVLTSRARALPDFIIVGAQRAGTTSVYNYLNQHPCVAAALTKEVHFFDVNFDKGLAWYRAFFPSHLRKYAIQSRRGRCITGEASPYYLFHPHVPRRVSEVLADVKLIVLLRNPVDRAFSHYHHELRGGRERLSFEAAIAGESERLQGEVERIHMNEDYHSFKHQCFTYLARGVYVDQLRTWMNYFPREQLLILKSEDVYAHPASAMTQVSAFLNLPEWESGQFRKYHAQAYPKIDPKTRALLADYFAPYNQQLYELLGVDFGWDVSLSR
jgi:hypothetical protein